MIRYSALALALALVGAAAPALAQEFKAGDITIDKAWSRATPKGADVGAGYLTIHNNGATPDKLTGGSADFAAVEIHEMKTENGVMKMRELKDGLNIPAHGTVRLAPGGYHIMFTHLTKPLVKGETVDGDAHLRARRAGGGAIPGRGHRRRRARADEGLGDMKGMKM